MKFREFTLSGSDNIYREQRQIEVDHVIDLLDRHSSGGVLTRRAEIFQRPTFQVAVQGDNETAPTVYVAVTEEL